MAENPWLQRVTTLHVWRQHGERAPHKPLLLLFALARLQHTGTSSMQYADVETDLQDLLDEFGPPRKTSPNYPFHHLTSDGLWVVKTKSGDASPGNTKKLLRESQAVGALAPDFADAVEQDGVLFSGIVQALLDANFPSSLHESLLSELGLELDPAESPGAATKSARRRNPAFREKVLEAYEYQCAVCGYDGRIKQQAVGIEAAHVRWWQAHGPTEVANAMALCALHHQLLDRGALGLTNDHRIQVSSHFIGRSKAVDALVALVGEPLLAPQTGHPPPDAKHIAWHSKEVFRAPARVLAAS